MEIKRILVTGSSGFIAKNLLAGLNCLENVEVMEFEKKDSGVLLESYLTKADVVYHLAGINRPLNEKEFEEGNADFTRKVVNKLESLGRNPLVVMTSSIQAALDNPYGRSKKRAEEILIGYSKKTGAKVCIYRLPGVFGKWSRPNYNSVVATFCYNIAHDLEITISDPDRELQLVYVDDVIASFINLLGEKTFGEEQYFYEVDRTFKVTLGDLAAKIYRCRDSLKSPGGFDFSDELSKCLYATYVSFAK